MKKYTVFPDGYYEVVVIVETEKEGIDVITKWTKYNKKDIKSQYIRIENYTFPTYIYLVRKEEIIDSVWAIDNGQYVKQKDYTPLTYKEFLDTFFINQVDMLNNLILNHI